MIEMIGTISTGTKMINTIIQFQIEKESIVFPHNEKFEYSILKGQTRH